MQFVVTALDFTDAGALERRLANREEHLAGVRQLIADGHLLSGGAILDDDERMIGSTMHVEFPDRATLEARLKADPYVTGRVWEWERIFISRALIVPMK